MNSSIRTIHGPSEMRPDAARRRSASARLGSDLEVVVETAVCPSSRKRAYDRSDSSIGSSASSSLTSRMRNVWNGEYHSRSQCVCGTIATVIGCVSGMPDNVNPHREPRRQKCLSVAGASRSHNGSHSEI